MVNVIKNIIGLALISLVVKNEFVQKHFLVGGGVINVHSIQNPRVILARSLLTELCGWLFWF